MIGQIVSAVVVAVLLVAVSVGWAMRGAVEVRDRLAPLPRSHHERVKQPLLLAKLSERRMILVWAFLLGFALLLLGRLLGRDLPVMAAMVLAFTYAVLSAMVTGFLVWVQAQRNAQAGNAPAYEGSLRWAVWAGGAVGALGVAYLIMDMVSSLTD